jgi:hypothetical protein
MDCKCPGIARVLQCVCVCCCSSLHNSFSRGDSPGCVPSSAQGKKRGGSRMAKKAAA